MQSTVFIIYLIYKILIMKLLQENKKFITQRIIFLPVILASLVCLSQPKTKAVIVGVSNYANLKTDKQLSFAHKDAIAFYNFLLNEQGLDSSSIKIFINEKASKDRVFNEISNIINQAKANENIILFFAGHGDSFDKIKTNAYLLLNKVDPSVEYWAPYNDAIAMEDIEYFVLKASDRNVNILIVLDVCHAGKIINDENDNQWAMKNFSKVNKNATKIISCAENEKSFEDSKWGGGHGAFTYYLLEGLKGKSNINNDNFITNKEINKFLAKTVSKDSPLQHPQLIGDSSKVLFPIPKSKGTSSLPSNMYSIKNQFYKILQNGNTRDINQHINQEFSPAVKALASQFNACLDSGYSIPSMYIPTQIFSKSQIGKEFSFTFSLGKTVCIAVDNQGKYFASGTKNGYLAIGEYEFDKSKDYYFDQKISDHAINDIQFTPNDEYLAANAGNKIIFIDLKEKKNVHTITLEKNSKVIRFIPNSSLLIYSQGADLVFYDLENGSIHKKISAHDNPIKDFIFRDDYMQAMSIAEDGSVTIWDTENWSKIAATYNFGEKFTTAIFSNKNDQLVVGYEMSKFDIFDLKSKKIIKTIAIKNKSNNKWVNVMQLQYLPDAGVLLRAGQDWNIGFYNDSSYTFAFDKLLIGNGILKVKFNPLANKLLILDVAGKVSIISFSQKRKYAIEILDLLLKNPEIKDFKNQFKSELAISLTLRAIEIIDNLSNGKHLPPTLEEIKEAIYELEFCEKLYNHDPIQLKSVIIKKLFLKAYQIIVTNEADKYSVANNYFDAILAIEPDAAYPHNAKSIIAKKLNQLEDAKKSLSIVTKNVSKWTEPKANTGKVYVRESQYDKAILEFEKIVTLEPNSSKGYFNLAQVYIKLGMLTKADEMLEKAINLDPQNPVIFIDKSIIEKLRGRFKTSEKILKNAIALNPQYYQGYVELGNLYSEIYNSYHPESHYVADALENYKKANQLIDNIPETKIALGQFYIKIFVGNDFDNLREKIKKTEILHKAELLFTEALKLNPFSIAAYVGLGYCDFYKGLEIIKCSKYFNEAISKNPIFPEGYHQMGLFLMAQKDTSLAIDLFNQAIEKDIKFIPSYIELLKIYTFHQKYRYDKLKNDLVNNLKQSPTILFEIAKLYYQQKNNEKAFEYASKAIDIDNDFSFAKSAIVNTNYILPPKDYAKDLIEMEFTEILKIDNQIQLVKLEKKYAFRYLFSNELLQTKVDTVIYAKNYIFSCRNSPDKGANYSVIHKSGKLLYFDNVHAINFIHPTLLRLEFKDKTMKLFNEKGYDFLNDVFEDIQYLSDTKLVLVKKDGKIGCYAINSKNAIPIQYQSITPYTIFIPKGTGNYAKNLLKCVYPNKGVIHLDENGKEYKK